ncbi:MAG: efflux RND transporter permease subunit [Alphaproteobacteria bacterium]|nr:efflux RND transporter permease subunit [Rhodospirillales bacterium]MCW9045532.1 efflux RND transporter permease subunit [Alphaproteobacteria bacterium]
MKKAVDRQGGIASWSIRHPIGIAMLTIAVSVVGIISYDYLSVDLLPEISYPGIRVRVMDPGVSARIMEDAVTRQLEEQLAVTEDAISVESSTTEGGSSVNLAFQYGKDIDQALRDASTRLDRAKRFLPDTIRPPVIFKFDPSQIPVLEYVIASPLKDPIELRNWVDYQFSKWFVNLPGVAAVEVGGGLVREIQVLPDTSRLSGLNLTTDDIVNAISQANLQEAAGRLESNRREYIGRTTGRFKTVEEIKLLPLNLPDGGRVRLGDIAEIVDGHEDDRLRVRLNGLPGVKLSIQKQPDANTVSVVEAVRGRLAWLQEQSLLPSGTTIETVADQSVYIQNGLRNAAQAAIGGALLAMLVVYLFLGDVRRTLVVGTAIPVSILVTFAIMGFGGLTMNIMTLGGLALGVGMVVDSTIVMIENIYRHQRLGQTNIEAGEDAAREVNSAIVASTSTNLAAIIPFLFISGLIGLLFKELIFTIAAAIIAAMVVALTLVPAFGSRVPAVSRSTFRKAIDKGLSYLENGYTRVLRGLLSKPLLQVITAGTLVMLLVAGIMGLGGAKQVFLPNMDDGRVRVSIVADPGIPIDEMDAAIQRLEDMFSKQPEVATVFSIVGGRIFGRSQRLTSNRTTMTVQLIPSDIRDVDSQAWVKRMQKSIGELRMAGFKVRMRSGGIRGIRTHQGNDDITLRVTGPSQEGRDLLGKQVADMLRTVPGLRNVAHSAEEITEELVFDVDHDRLSELGLSVETVARAARIALEGELVTEFLDNDRSYNIRVRLPVGLLNSIQELESIPLAPGKNGQGPVYLGEVAKVNLTSSPAEILRDNQRRITETTASLTGEIPLGDVVIDVEKKLAEFSLPEGYGIYDTGASKSLKEGQYLTMILLGLALFLVFVVMAVQYESLRNPLIIMLGVPFTIIGVAFGVVVTGQSLSMSVWLGVIMLAGIVVNNAIVLVEYFEIMREQGLKKFDAIIEAGRVRLRPILMTTLTTICGLLPLAIGAGEGTEMLQPLAITIVFGLSFSMIVTLIFMPVLYALIGVRDKLEA